MEPLPEVRVAAARLAALTGTDLLDTLDALAELVLAVVPSCVGVSLTVMVDGEPFTLTSTSEDGALLDAVQYLGGGPCSDTAGTGTQLSVPDVLDEDRWQDYGKAAGVCGIRSSLSLPIAANSGNTPGAINLYASEPDAFKGNEVLLAGALEVPVEHLVSNADLSFMTRDFARQLPERLQAKEQVDVAVGLLVGMHGWEPDEARSRLRAAAARAGVAVDKVADLVLALHG